MHDTGCHMDSRRETFASFPVIFFYHLPAQYFHLFQLTLERLPGPETRFDSEVRPVYHDTVFRVKLR